jgi:serine phosphatase RsbU (regulator of sigma subunit)
MPTANRTDMAEDKILVVDDEIANLQKLRRTFVNRYQVLAASSGREALQLVKANEDIACIIADQRMPDMTGIEFLRYTINSLPDAIRIILTGYTDVDVLVEAINTCKVFRYIVKPWDPPDLIMTVERGLEKRLLTLENAQFRKELIRRERLARELEIARDIQRYILPPASPELHGFKLAVVYEPAREVGGDLYDFDYNAAGNELSVIIGDVSGKSIPAALYGAVFSGQIRSLFGNPMSPAKTLGLLNRNLLDRYQVKNYIAVAYLRIHLESGTGWYANGGMPYPYLVRAGEVSRIAVPGVPLGLLEDSVYDQASVRLEKGDTLILASDGSTDALNPDGELFDPHRFVQAIQDHCREDTEQFVRSLYRGIADFTVSGEIADDVTIIALKRLE